VASYLDRLRLDGRVVIVAGAGGGGIGTETCRALSDAGARVVAVDVSDQKLDGVPCELPVVGDIRSIDSCRQIVDTTVANLGGVDGLVNVVGGALAPHWGALVDITEQQWDDVLGFNLHGVVVLTQQVVRWLKANGRPGSVVHLSSLSGLVSSPFHAGYGAAKAVVVHVTRTMAVEWGPLGIRVNAIAPGSITTPRAGAVADPVRDRAATALGRRGNADDIAGAVLFLMSDLAAYVTGQTLAVDGGSAAKTAFTDAEGVPVFVTNPAILERIHGTGGAGGSGS
jgi:NAD(P)-dependent dehydrogenase (short-subunit alcohol dehydrogenase family)